MFLMMQGLSFAAGPIQGAKSSGMGSAFVAVVDDPSAMAVNPAGLTQIKGTNLYGGPTFVIPSTKFTSPSGQSEETAFQVFFPPNLYISSDCNREDLRLGIGIFSPFGVGGRKWDRDGLTRYISTESSIATIEVNPTIAYRLSPKVSVGLGVVYMLSRNEAERMLNQSALGFRDGQLKLKGTGGGWGYNLGVLFTPDRRVSLGLAYRSKIKVTHHGDVEIRDIAPPLQPAFGGSEFSTDMQAPVTFPDVITFGIAYRPSDRMTIALDFERVGWSSFDRTAIDLEKEVPEVNITDVSVPLNWEDAWLIKVGIDYKVSEMLSIRGGYAFVRNQAPDATLDPSSPDSNQHNVSIGLGIKRWGMTFDFFYIAGIFEDRKVQNHILSGSYDNFVNYFGFGIGKKF